MVSGEWDNSLFCFFIHTKLFDSIQIFSHILIFIFFSSGNYFYDLFLSVQMLHSEIIPFIQFHWIAVFSLSLFYYIISQRVHEACALMPLRSIIHSAYLVYSTLTSNLQHSTCAIIIIMNNEQWQWNWKMASKNDPIKILSAPSPHIRSFVRSFSIFTSPLKSSSSSTSADAEYFNFYCLSHSIRNGLTRHSLHVYIFKPLSSRYIYR